MVRSHASLLPSAHHPVVRLVLPVVLLLLCLCGILVYVIMLAREAHLERAGQTATSLIAAISKDVSRNIEILDLSLQGIVDDLKYPEIDHLDPELRQRVLFDRSVTARHLGRVLVIDENGDLRIDSRTLDPQPLNLADRDYFQVHKVRDDIGTYIGLPERTKVSREWFIGISRRLSHPNGSFAGVVSATLRLSFFSELFKDVALGSNGDVMLLRTDGTLVMRWPYDEAYIGRDLSDSPLFAHASQSRSGVYQANSAADGLHRLVVYSQVGNLPLVAAIGQSTDQVYANWRRNSRSVVLLVSGLCLMTVLLAVYLAREVTRRESAERNLAVLAMFDALTSLFNRRYLEDVLDREWRRCTRMRLPIAMLIIDVDRLESYNEMHGFEAGDTLLKAIGESVSKTLKRATDFGARYGGDEFAILVSGASAAEAQNISRFVRQQFSTDCRKAGITPAGLSIGVALAVPKPGGSPSLLVDAAEKALANAKQHGPGRTDGASDLHEQNRAA
jgi:diguanylate cyclase (GGDEF)-like protein